MVIREKKRKAVEEIKGKITASNAVILTDYRGLNVAEITDLRRKLREENVEYKVVKNTLTKIAVSEAGVEGLDTYLEGPTAIAFSKEDPVAPAKILSNFAKNNDKLKIKGGLLTGKFIDLNEIKVLADLPPREVLLGKVVGSLQAPVYGMVYAMQGLLQKTVYALKAICEQRQEA